MADEHGCKACGAAGPVDDDYLVCGPCLTVLGPVLARATWVELDYMIGLKSGNTIRFSHATFYGNWLELHDIDDELYRPFRVTEQSQQSQVQVDSISWAIIGEA